MRQIFSYIPESAEWNWWIRLFRLVVFFAIIAGLVAVVILTDVTVGDIFASILALIPTGWGILCVSSHNYCSSLHAYVHLVNVKNTKLICHYYGSPVSIYMYVCSFLCTG